MEEYGPDAQLIEKLGQLKGMLSQLLAKVAN
jgi:hypothetical protein